MGPIIKGFRNLKISIGFTYIDLKFQKFVFLKY